MTATSQPRTDGYQRDRDDANESTPGAVRWSDPAVLRELLGLPADDKRSTPALSGWRSLVCTWGIASLFAVNGIVAFVSPESFSSVLEANPIGARLPSSLISPMVVMAGVNDLVLAVAVVVAKHRRFVWIWVALWMALIAAVKMTNLLFA